MKKPHFLGVFVLQIILFDVRTTVTAKTLSNLDYLTPISFITYDNQSHVITTCDQERQKTNTKTHRHTSRSSSQLPVNKAHALSDRVHGPWPLACLANCSQHAERVE